MNAPRVSVVMPSYNHQDYVAETVRSVLDQRGLEDPRAGALELIVIDDGSTDATWERLQAFDDPRLRLTRQDNAGAHVAFNLGLEQARGEIICLLNSDDVYEPDRLSSLIQHFDAHPEHVAVGSWLSLIDQDGHEIGVKRAWHSLPPWPQPVTGPGLAELGDPRLALLESNYLATTSNIAFRRSTGDKADAPRFRDLRYCHDWDFFLQLCQRGELGLIERPLVRYRVHPENTLKEGTAQGQARMRFEILWLIGAHAHRLLSRVHPGLNLEAAELRRRAGRSLPRFASADALLWQLIALRGDGSELPASYEALLDLEHPWRHRAEARLADLNSTEESS